MEAREGGGNTGGSQGGTVWSRGQIFISFPGSGNTKT